ncbi:MAG: transporter [Lachnospiraceae bacterium]|nr:transporter [Lachnospiraceae bacterium]
MKRYKSILILHMVLAVYSILGIASKLASKEQFMSFRFIVLYGVVVGSLFLYAIIWQQLLKQISLITAYANKAITIIWGMIWGAVFFQEEITIQKGIGGIVIMMGIYLVVSNDNKKRGEI